MAILRGASAGKTWCRRWTPQGYSGAPSGGRCTHEWEGVHAETAITRKFYGDDVLIERAGISLAGNRGLLLVGEPGTAGLALVKV